MPIAPYGGVIFAGLAALGAVEGEAPQASPAPEILRIAAGEQAEIGSLVALCTNGRSETEKRDYTLHVAAANGDGKVLKDAIVDVALPEGSRVRLQCRDEWLLMRVPVGTYQIITAAADSEPQAKTVDVPAYGTVRVAMSFAKG